jgi:outer membrane protein assembly factor BamB
MSDIAAPATPSVPTERIDPRPRLWPAVVIVILMWAGMLIPGWLAPISLAHMFGWMLSPLIGLLLLAGWWLFFSRLGWRDRLLGFGVFAALGVAACLLSDPTVGVVGVMLFGLPFALTACVVWLVVSFFLRWPTRRVGLLLVALLGWGWLTVVRNDGADGSMNAEIYYRWGEKPEDKFLADRAAGKITKAKLGDSGLNAPATLQGGDWPAFRGPQRDGKLAGVRIATNWTDHPPKELWRHRVGPGWSSFAVIGDRLYTQEQHGPEEVVICYDANTGEIIWDHRDQVRFNETMAGPGPRATPTFHDGKLYTQGATGLLQCLDAATGKPLWKRDIAADTDAKTPEWGFSASPFIHNGVVITFTGAGSGKSIAAYQTDTGKPVWTGGDAKVSYGSLQLSKVDGVEQLLITSDSGLTGFDPASGKQLWHHDWSVPGMARVVQPTQVGDADFLIGTSFGFGTRRVHVKKDADQWTTEEVWTSRAMKPYYNDQVAHKGHIFGFDNAYLACINAADGKLAWKERGYGNGQILLLPDQDLLLIVSEKGEVALIEATPEGHKQRGKFQAIKGKTWNHPVIANGKLFVRNGEEMACFALEPASEGK